MFDLMHSRTRAALLGLLFTDVEQEWHVRGLARELGVSPGNVRRELMRLRADGYLLSRSQANLVLYRLNVAHPLYPELQAVVRKTVGAEAVVRRALAAVPGVEMAFVFGSVAAHTEGPTSDIDLMVVGQPPVRDLHVALRPVEDELRREVHYFVFASDELAQRVRDHDGFMLDVLAGERRWVLGDESRLQTLVASGAVTTADR